MIIHTKYILKFFVEANFMDREKWLLMTYYCPTHGNSGMLKLIEITKNELSQTLLKKNRTYKN